ncbi:MAG: hypothetical protein Q9169_002232 [Polycauliona sp. 2 TL-2023]
MATPLQDTYGLLELYSPPNPMVDICFVHGLRGGNISTWCLKGKDFCWPRDMLQHDVADARILSFGYDANIVQFWFNKPGKGICLGGLALLSAHRSAEKSNRAIADSARGIVFLGTPFQGSDLTKWITLGNTFARLFGDTNPELPNELHQGSYQLKNISEKFPEWLRDTDTTAEIVTHESAKIDGYQVLTLHANHQDMCKFSDRDDAKYQAVMSVLRGWVNDLKEPKKKKTQEWSVEHWVWGEVADIT